MELQPPAARLSGLRLTSALVRSPAHPVQPLPRPRRLQHPGIHRHKRREGGRRLALLWHKHIRRATAGQAGPGSNREGGRQAGRQGLTSGGAQTGTSTCRRWPAWQPAQASILPTPFLKCTPAHFVGADMCAEVALVRRQRVWVWPQDGYPHLLRDSRPGRGPGQHASCTPTRRQGTG